ncbi:hypothetical protein GmHk_14G041270 [Glycine max]|nr:hypothetical protein GmHk_14G041270 [Glycine max]
MNNVQKKAQAIQKQNTAPHILSRGGYEYLEQKLLAEKTKKKLEEAAQSGSVDGIIDPSSPVRRHVKRKMAGTKKTGEMTTEAAKEIAEKIGGVEEVKDADAPLPVPTDEVSLVGQAIDTFLAWPTHLVKSLSQQATMSLAKPPQKPNPEVDDPLYLMTLAILELFLRLYQVTWDATVFGVFNPDFPLYIKYKDLSEIAHGDQCLSISVHLTETSMRAGNSDIYGFLKPQSIQRSGQSQFETESYIKSWMQSSKHDVYLGAYLNGGHWQMVVIVPKEHLVVWFCSLHNRPDNYLKEIINSALKGLDDAPQPKSKAPARWIVVKYLTILDHWSQRD